MKQLCVISLLLAFTISSAWAKRFSNQYCEFELPTGWQCALEGSEYVCQSESDGSKKEAIIILAAKRRGEQDSMEEYEAYLKKQKTYNLPGGKIQISEAKYTKKTPVNGHDWVDALHLASEVPGFYTRYLATVKEDLGVAVTFSVAKDLYEQYKGIFDGVVASLRVFRQKSDTGTNVNLAGGEEDLGGTVFVPDGDKVDISVQKTQQRKGDEESSDMMLLFGIIAVAGVIIFLKKKGKKKG
ncbi:MAG: hypothetical protein ACLGG0_12025 [Bacteriovoracia bacterium]